jgi:hypothetical protein
MAKDPAFLFYPSDFLTGTMFMTNEQVGKFIRLLCAQHQHGHLTLLQMQSLCGGIADADILSKFEVDNAGLYFNKRVDDEIIKRKNHSLKQSKNASMRWHSDGKATGMPLEDRNRNVNKDIIKEEDNIKKKKEEKVFIAPNLEEVITFFKTSGYSIQVGEKAFNYYNSADWKDSKGTKIKNWKQKMIGVWFKDENKKDQQTITTQTNAAFF